MRNTGHNFRPFSGQDSEEGTGIGHSEHYTFNNALAVVFISNQSQLREVQLFPTDKRTKFLVRSARVHSFHSRNPRNRLLKHPGTSTGIGAVESVLRCGAVGALFSDRDLEDSHLGRESRFSRKG